MAVWIGVGWLLTALIGWAIGDSKGRGAEGFWLSAIFGPVGWLIIGVMGRQTDQDERVACPHCAEQILASANVCRYCGRDVGSGSSTRL